MEYKAALAGIPVLLVDPRNTSRTCSVCGYCDQANRKSQAFSQCQHCGYSTSADFNASRNIRDRADVNRPQNWTSPKPKPEHPELRLR
ncbi:MAG: transposase [Acetobacteraceae bacterium]|nr:transposase [Acetobacteraceae bacterium]